MKMSDMHLIKWFKLYVPHDGGVGIKKVKEMDRA